MWKVSYLVTFELEWPFTFELQPWMPHKWRCNPLPFIWAPLLLHPRVGWTLALRLFTEKWFRTVWPLTCSTETKCAKKKLQQKQKPQVFLKTFDHSFIGCTSTSNSLWSSPNLKWLPQPADLKNTKVFIIQLILQILAWSLDCNS